VRFDDKVKTHEFEKYMQPNSAEKVIRAGYKDDDELEMTDDDELDPVYFDNELLMGDKGIIGKKALRKER